MKRPHVDGYEVGRRHLVKKLNEYAVALANDDTTLGQLHQHRELLKTLAAVNGLNLAKLLEAVEFLAALKIKLH